MDHQNTCRVVLDGYGTCHCHTPPVFRIAVQRYELEDVTRMGGEWREMNPSVEGDWVKYDEVEYILQLKVHAEGSRPGYNCHRIAWELERTAKGDGFYGNSLRVAKDIPGVTDDDRALLDRYATGRHDGTDHVKLQTLALRIDTIISHERAES